MAPTGRAGPAHPGGPRPPQQGNVRNEVFENIFGRPAGGHHLGHGPPPGAHPGGAAHRPPPQPGNPYAMYAPGPPPQQQPQQQQFNPAQPRYPPGQGYGQPAPSGQPQQRFAPQQGYPQQHPHGAPVRVYQPHEPGYPQDGGSNGFPRPRGPSYGAPPHQQQQLQPDPNAKLPNRRASLVASVHGGVSGPSAMGFTPNQNGGGRVPSFTNVNATNNGYSNERLPHVNTLSPLDYGAPGPSAMPTPRSVSATSAVSSNASTVTSANIPPRSRSLHASKSTSRIRVTIPNQNMGTGAPQHPQHLDYSAQHRESASPPPDYLRGLQALTFDSGSRTDGGPRAGTPGPLDDIPGIPDRQSRDLGLLSGPWEPTSTSTDSRQDVTRHTSSGSAHSSRSQRIKHSRQQSDSSIASSIYTIGGQRMAPLSQIDADDQDRGSPSTPTGSENGYGSFHRLSGRKSMESTHSLPLPNNLLDSPLPPGAANSVFDHRAMSFNGSGVNRREIVSAVRSSGSLHASPITSSRSLNRKHSASARHAASTLTITVIPSLLSNVAEAFRQLIQPAELLKEGITYKDSFDGRTAVSIIADIIKTPDRNLALLLGRALDAQKFFHDVTYAHRLRDTPNEVYQFKERLVAPFMISAGGVDSPSSEHMGLTRPSSSSSANAVARPVGTRVNTYDSTLSSIHASDSASFFAAGTTPAAVTPVEEDSEEDDLPNGVFTLLTGCYSPTCSREALCYSINCPRRLEQMKRLNMKSVHPGLSRKIEDDSLHDEVKETGTLWIHSVSQEVLDSVDDTEKKRQEAINEVIYTERDFVRDLEYLRDQWVKPLRTENVIEASRRDDFVQTVFWNVTDVLNVNHVLADRLTKRQKQQPVVHAIGDIFLEIAQHFEPFVVYGAHQLFGKYEFEKEKGANPAFQKFVDETERKPESRKLELNGYLTKPTTRLGRYPLLLEAVLKYTPDDHPDKTDLPEVIKMIRAFLTKVNAESGKSENVFELAQLEQQLVFRPHENIDLRLRDKNRELVHKGPMKRRGGTQGENADLLAFLFDHAFLLVKTKWVNKAEQYKVYRRPVPLELLVLITPEDHYNSAKLSASSRSKLISRSGTRGAGTALSHVPPKPESKHGFSLTLVHLGRKGYTMQLWVDTYVSRKRWIENIEKQQQIIRDRSAIFMTESISEGFFQGLRRINCISPYDNGNRMIYGTDEGVYFSNLRDPKLREPVKVINLVDVTQVDVIEEYQLLIVLHERSVTTFPLDCLDPNDPNAALKRGKRISSHTSFFKTGLCLGRTLVAVVKSSSLSSTIKVLEPIDQNMRGKKPQTGFMKRLNGGQETLKIFKEFYIPLESFSVYFLKTKLCVGCQKGFEIVDLETLDMQSLLDPSDPSLDFVLKRDGVRPMAIYRIEGDFLLCYDEFAFYVNKNGWRSRPKWAIIWEGTPTSFALQYPFVIAFDHNMVEVRHVETGHLMQVIPGHNISCLFADMPPSTVNAPPMPQSRQQLMYPNQQGGAYGQRPAPQGPYGQPYGQFPQPHPAGVRPPPGYGMPPPMAPIRNFAFRPQVIFSSDDGHVQFLKFPPPGNKPRRSSDSKSVHSTR